MTDIELLRSWLCRARAVEKAHFRACVLFRNRHLVCGCLLVGSAAFASALTGAGVTGTISSPIGKNVLVALRGLFAIVVPVTAAVVTFLGHNARSSEHHHAAAKFAAVKRQLLIAISRREESDAEDARENTYATLEAVRQTWDDLTENMPALYANDETWQAEIGACEEEVGLRTREAG